MIGALWTGISGLDSHQTALDNESHNIANVNTVGYKASRISFADQMYQDKIGKGSKVLDAEKLYTQGNLKLTGVSYDMALSGEGFFTVKNTQSSGTAETLYTRAGNFRMGDNGTLQDAAGNEVQGWAMNAIDTASDVSSSNPNVTMFTSDYEKLISSKIVRHSNYIETFTAKATDYTQTASADSEAVFSGAGYKTQSSKIADVEALISDYSTWLQRLKEQPDGASASSTAQVSQINFKTGSDGLVTSEGDQIYVYIDGNKIAQSYVATIATDEFMADFYTNISGAERTALGLTTDPTTGTVTPAEQAVYDREASRIATYKALADTISEIPGMKAYMASEGDTGVDDVLESSDTFTMSTANKDMYKGIIQIESLVPGRAFTITEVAEVSGSNTVQGNYQTKVNAEAGSGIGALNSSKEALMKVLTGKQQDVYTTSDLFLNSSTPATNNYTYGITIYDKDSGTTIPVPNDNGIPPSATTISITNVTSLDYFVSEFNNAAQNSSPALSDYVEAKNINGKLVIQTLDTNFDVEFSGSLKTDTVEIEGMITYGSDGSNATGIDTYSSNALSFGSKDYTYQYSYISSADPTTPVTNTVTITNPADLDAVAVAIDAVADISATVDGSGNLVVTVNDTGRDISNFTASFIDSNATVPIDKNNNYSGREGAGAEFIEIVTRIDQTASQGSQQLRLDTLGISDSAFGEFSVDATGLITMKQDGAEFAVGQVSIALFNNNRGLEPRGDNLLAKSNESGDPIYNVNNEKTAKIEGKTLELSTADLSESLVNLMVFQRAFEANAKSITTSDQLLNTLINLKRS